MIGWQGAYTFSDLRRVAAYDESGSIIGGGFSYVDLVPAHGQAAAEVSVTVPGKPAKIELYAALSSLSDLKP